MSRVHLLRRLFRGFCQLWLTDAFGLRKLQSCLQEALEHPYFEMLHDERIEPTCKAPFYFGFEERELSRQEFRSEVLRELLNYGPTSRENQKDADPDHSAAA
jgi:hypothetical protein